MELLINVVQQAKLQIYPESHPHDTAQKHKKEKKLRLPIIRAVEKADTGNLIAGWWKNKC